MEGQFFFMGHAIIVVTHIENVDFNRETKIPLLKVPVPVLYNYWYNTVYVRIKSDYFLKFCKCLESFVLLGLTH
jgi:hypothetical protein